MGMGPLGGGKTSLFYSLALGTKAGSRVKTVTSMKARAQTVAPVEGQMPGFRLVDYPGHGRLRLQLGEHIPHASCVIFVVDSTDTSVTTVQDAAEFLYSLFTMSSYVAANPKLAIVCNKSDLPGAAPIAKWRRLLETEITQVNKTS